MEKYLEAGKIVNTHGVKGDLKVECRCDDQETFASLDTLYLKKGGEYLPYRCTKNQPMKHLMLVHLESIDSMEEAMLLKNRSLYADRADFNLPEGSYFIADLIGTLEELASSGKAQWDLLIPQDKMGLVSELYGEGTVLEVEYLPEGAKVTALLDGRMQAKCLPYKQD